MLGAIERPVRQIGGPRLPAGLGLGISPPDTSLGLLIAIGEPAASTRPWLFYFPGLMIALIVLSVNLVGDALRDAFDPTDEGAVRARAGRSRRLSGGA